MKVLLVSDFFADPKTWRGRTSPPEAALQMALSVVPGVQVQTAGRVSEALRARADVAHLHFLTPMSRHLIRELRIPFVVTLHEGPQISYLRPGDPGYPYSAGPLHEATKRSALGLASATIALCEQERNAIISAYRLEPRRVRTIPNGVDVSAYRRDARRSPRLVLVSIGQVRHHKGYHVLLDALALLPPDIDLEVRIIGHRGDLVPAYTERARHLGVSDRIAFLGGMSTTELAEELAHADAYVQPSLAECAPITVLEALASGLPVIGSRLACIPEQVGDAGLVVPPNDPDALADAIQRLAMDAHLRESLGTRARRRCEAMFDITSIANAHVALYQAAIDDPQPASFARRTRQAGMTLLSDEVLPRARDVVRPAFRAIAPKAAARRIRHSRGEE
jgi:glycosyltransferase involved in cell wall biosynthesis